MKWLIGVGAVAALGLLYWLWRSGNALPMSTGGVSGTTDPLAKAHWQGTPPGVSTTVPPAFIPRNRSWSPVPTVDTTPVVQSTFEGSVG